MNNNYPYEPRSPRSASTALNETAAFKPTRRPNWALAKNVPWQVRQARIEQDAKERRTAIVDAARHVPTKSIFLVVKRIPGNKIRAIGFPDVFPNFQAAKDFARNLGRSRVKMGAVVASV